MKITANRKIKIFLSSNQSMTNSKINSKRNNNKLNNNKAKHNNNKKKTATHYSSHTENNSTKY